MRSIPIPCRLLLPIAMFTTLFTSASYAEAGPFVGVRAGAHFVDDGRHYFSGEESYSYRDEGYAFGIQLGHRFDNRFALRTYYDRLRTSISDYDSSGTGHSYGADVLFYLSRPIYLGVGANSTQFNHERNQFWRATLGFEAPLRDRFALRFEVAMQSDDEFTEPYAGLSLNYRLDRDMNEQMLPRVFRERRATRQNAATQNQSAATATPYQTRATTLPILPTQANRTPALATQLNQLADNFAVFFDFNSAELNRASLASVDALAQLLLAQEDAVIEIHGHTDLTGEDAYNVWLSQQRADAVAAMLIADYGIESQRIKTRGYGMQKPLINEVSPDANASNRRIEVVLTNQEQRLVLAAGQPEP